MPSVPSLEPQVAEALGSRVRELRTAAGMTQEQLAHRAGISRNHVQVIERGWQHKSDPAPSNPHLSVLLRLSAAMGVSIDAVIDGLPIVEYDPKG